jgi:hypothetical protein
LMHLAAAQIACYVKGSTIQQLQNNLSTTKHN